MTPVYFPFTYLSPGRLDRLLLLLPSLSILQPTGRPAGAALAEAARSGRVQLHFPAPEAGNAVESLIREYRQWAQARPQADLTSFAQLQRAALSSDDGSVHRIAGGIRQAAAGHGHSAPRDLLPAQLLFLAMAQEFDRQHATTGRRLRACRLAERQMLRRLTGSRDASAETMAAPSDRGASPAYMLPQRLAAWAGLYRQHAFAAPLFVTDEPAVIRQLAERHPGLAEKATLAKTGRTASPDALLRRIGSLLTDAAKPAHQALSILQTASVNAGGLRLTLHVDASQAADAFWAAFRSGRQTAAAATGEMGKRPATIIALVED